MAIRVPTVAASVQNNAVTQSAVEPVLEFVSSYHTSAYNHYHSIAYAIVITAYLLGFGEYVMLRLKILIRPERQVYFSSCGKHPTELIGKAAYHYAVVLVAFIVVALFQLVCFFGLTISSKWMYCSINDGFERSTQMRQRLASRIRNQMRSTLIPTFACYILCALSIMGMIYYMDGVQDALDSTVASILLYAFDSAIISYFLSFPLIRCLYGRPATTRCRKDDRNNNIIYMEATSAQKPVAITNTSGAAPILIPRRYSYLIANEELIRDYRNSESLSCPTASSFVRNTRLTTTV